jgi:hypothetical protein
MENNSLQSVLESIALAESDYQVRSYSGRGMYGDTCLAVTIRGNLFELFAQVLRVLDGDRTNLTEEVADAFSMARQDDMGRGTVVYFPGVKYVEAASDEEDESDPEACPGCDCKPGDGVTKDCDDAAGCGYYRALAAELADTDAAHMARKEG